VQEGLINALRHAHAARIEISVKGEPQRIHVSVSDDGVGLAQDWERPGHFGLRGLKERVAQLGGALRVGNRDSRGVALSADIPLGAAP
jgi:two-component system sensor histidine kinase UhpB